MKMLKVLQAAALFVVVLVATVFMLGFIGPALVSSANTVDAVIGALASLVYIVGMIVLFTYLISKQGD